MKVTRSVIVER